MTDTVLRPASTQVAVSGKFLTSIPRDRACDLDTTVGSDIPGTRHYAVQIEGHFRNFLLLPKF